jgi:hypothetical protein
MPRPNVSFRMKKRPAPIRNEMAITALVVRIESAMRYLIFYLKLKKQLKKQNKTVTKSSELTIKILEISFEHLMEKKLPMHQSPLVYYSLFELFLEWPLRFFHSQSHLALLA